MDTNNEPGTEVEENLDLPEVQEGEQDTTDWKAEAQKLREKAIGQRERTKALKRERDELKAKVDSSVGSNKTHQPSKAEGLDEVALDYLDVKGITDDADIQIVENIVKKTGMTVRQALKDEYVQTKLKANQAEREVKSATPSGTHRTGSGQTNDLGLAIAKYESSGFDPSTLPEDFELRSKVINAISDKNSSNKPAFL